MKTYPLQTILDNARHNSPFYRKHLAKITHFSDIPPIDIQEFWQASAAGELLTCPQDSGLVFKSGGTSGAPKFSFFTQDEWNSFCAFFGWGMAQGDGICDGDRVANTFYAGQLYASFLFIQHSIELSGVKATEYPLGGQTSFEELAATIKLFHINVLAGVPTSIIQFMQYLTAQQIELPSLKKILFGGESMYEDQQTLVKATLPSSTCQSIGWASVDGGLLGYRSKDCSPGEHRTFSEATIMELIDEDTGDIINEVGKRGKILLTNLTRQMMPIIRYPVGDSGFWTEPPGANNRKLLLAGRVGDAARVGPATVYLDDLRSICAATLPKDIQILGVQVVIRHYEHRDQLTIKIALSNDRTATAYGEKIATEICKQRKMLSDLIQQKIIHPVVVEISELKKLAQNPRTGKLRLIIDERFNKESGLSGA